MNDNKKCLTPPPPPTKYSDCPLKNKKEVFLSFSQEFEDLILYHALHNIKNGFYVDIGANDPNEDSITKAFYDKDWSGINIEPLKDRYANLCNDRKRDINLNIGVGDKNGEMEFYINDGLTSCDKKTIERMKNKKNIVKSVFPVFRLQDILKKYIKDQQAIHFCKIDVEGFERSVLEGMDFQENRPWVMCLEATLPETGIACHQMWEDLLLNNDYELLFIHGINRYYADKLCADYKTIKSNMDNFDNFSQYEIFVHTKYARRQPMSNMMKLKHYFLHFLRFAKFYIPFKKNF